MTGLGQPHWDGTPGRMEVWYATGTDNATGAGWWFHAETVASVDGSEAVGHGWISLFPPDGAGEPSTARWGRAPLERGRAGQEGDTWWRAGGVAVEGTATGCRLVGDADGASIDVTLTDDSAPIWTYSRAAWDRHLLPGCQFVPLPAATGSGKIVVGDRALDVDGPANLARIYGHGNAQRWGWLHADLGGGDVLEVVAATARRPGLRKVPPLAAVQLRVDGEDWPSSPLKVLPRFRTSLALPTWTVRGTSAGRRIDIAVTQLPERCVALDYADPDGAPAVCTNTERADIEIRLEKKDAGSWATERTWSLAGTGHAEVGLRP
ncbi:MAG TPA: hypothetical protein VGA13_08265 [Acidimicrobiales bacterium]